MTRQSFCGAQAAVKLPVLNRFGLLTKANAAFSAIFLVATLTPFPSFAEATAAMSPVGLWRSIDDKTGQPRAEIRIKATSNGALNGVIEKAIVPSADPLCSACTDDRKDQPKLGMEIIRGAVKSEETAVWDGGKILDPDNGRVYRLRLNPIEGGNKLEVRGSFGPFWRTQTWIRVN